MLRESSFPVEALDAQSSLCNQIKHSIRAPKTVIYQQGDLPQSVFSLRRGFVKLTQLSKEGEEKIVRILGPGYTLGMESLSQQNYKQTAEALTEVDFCTIPAAMLIEMSNQQPLICHEIINQWQRQLEDADNWLSEFYAGTIIQRLCRFL